MILKYLRQHLSIENLFVEKVVQQKNNMVAKGNDADLSRWRNVSQIW